MRKTLYFPILISFVIAFVLGCANDSTADLIDLNQVDEITYANTVKSIIDNNCISCHATVPVNGAPTSLTTYEFVKSAVLTTGLLDRISRPQGESGMMPNGGTRLPQAKIDQIFQWANNGFPE